MIGTELDDELILLNPKLGDIFGLKDVGLEIWQRLVEPKRFDDLVEGLMQDFNVPQVQCETEVGAFLKVLANSGMILIDEQ